MSWLEEQLNFYDKTEYSSLFKASVKEGYEDCSYDLSKKLLEQLNEDIRPQVEKVLKELGVSLK